MYTAFLIFSAGGWCLVWCSGLCGLGYGLLLSTGGWWVSSVNRLREDSNGTWQYQLRHGRKDLGMVVAMFISLVGEVSLRLSKNSKCMLTELLLNYRFFPESIRDFVHPLRLEFETHSPLALHMQLLPGLQSQILGSLLWGCTLLPGDNLWNCSYPHIGLTWECGSWPWVCLHLS